MINLKKVSLSNVLGLLNYVAIFLMLFLLAYSSFKWLITFDVWGLGGIFWASWMTFAIVYLGVSIFLRMNGVPAAEIFIISLTSLISMIWLYEILFHFSFWDSWNYGKPPYFLLNVNTIFISYGLISLSALSGYKYMKANKWFWLALLTTAVLWIFWITIGFPQFEFPKVLYDFAWPKIPINNPQALAFPLNTITKLLLSFSYVLLYLPSRQKFYKVIKSVKHFLVERGFLDN
ncbi:MAG: hypothetical protein ACXV2C_02700 [Candidatus Bathyarchaeia archaeon]